MPNSDIGLIGVGTMGANLALNIVEKGFSISLYDLDEDKAAAAKDAAGALANRVTATRSLAELVASIVRPRTIILLIPAGDPVDAQIAELRPLLDDDDLIIDAGNANFHDTNRRAEAAARSGVPFLGIGVSGGAEGARHGPAIMGGGARAAWDRVAHILEAIAAKYEGSPCATWMGEGGAGHFVKSVHNGIEYADMQMIAEVYGVMRDGLGQDAETIGNTFQRWNDGVLKSYLVEISGIVSQAQDATSDQPVLDIILDRAGQKGTGRWTVIEAQHLGAPVPVIEAAVSARNISALLGDRQKGEAVFGPAPTALRDGELSQHDLESALIAGKIMCYAQGFALLNAARTTFEWAVPMPAIAEVWREGCIIRSAMLNDMARALKADPTSNLMFAPFFSDLIRRNEPGLRKVVSMSLAHGLPVPALASALTYFDMMRTERSTANMTQAQRDFFGAHGFERVDAPGAHHGPWAIGEDKA